LYRLLALEHVYSRAISPSGKLDIVINVFSFQLLIFSAIYVINNNFILERLDWTRIL